MPTIAEQFINQGIEIGREKGIELGRQEGEIQGKIDDILEILETRFSFVPSIIKIRLEQIDTPDVLKSLLKSAVTIGAIDEFLDIVSKIK